MEIVGTEKKTHEALAAKMEQLFQAVAKLLHLLGDKQEKKWLTTYEVCQVLKISKRTLQTLRDNRTLPYTKIGNITYYKEEDVVSIISKVEDRRKEAKFRNKTI